MELHFCDICNESVPQSDLDRERAFLRHGRVVCAQCESAMAGAEADAVAETAPGAASPGGTVLGDFGSGGQEQSASPGPGPARGFPPPPPPLSGGRPAVGPIFMPPAQRSGIGGLLLVGLMAAAALVVSSIVTVVLVERIQESRGQSVADLARMERRLASQLSELERTMAGWRESDGVDRAREHDALQSAEASHRSRSTARLDVIDARLEAIGRVSLRLDELETAVKRDRSGLNSVSSNLAQVKRDLGVLAERWVEALATGDVVADDREAVAAVREPEWMEHTRGLASPSAATRWSAVTALGETKDPGVVPHLLAMLEDPDIFVRMATARILGDLRGEEAIGSLIDALDDEEPAVREAVVLALRSITAESFRYDPMASESDRARRVKAWRDWWKKNKA